MGGRGPVVKVATSNVVSRSRWRSYSSRKTGDKEVRCDSVAKPKRASPCSHCYDSNGKWGVLLN